MPDAQQLPADIQLIVAPVSRRNTLGGPVHMPVSESRPEECLSLSPLLPMNSTTVILPDDVVSKTGPRILGYLFHWGLFGVLSMQVYMYYLAFPRDPTRNKVFVYMVYALEVLQTVIITQSAFHVFGAGYGRFSDYDHVELAWFSVPVISGLVAFIAEIFYAYRISILSESYRVAGLIVTLATVQLIGAIATAVVLKDAVLFSRLLGPHFFITAAIWNGGSAVCDVIIAVCMTYYCVAVHTHPRDELANRLSSSGFGIRCGILTTIASSFPSTTPNVVDTHQGRRRDFGRLLRVPESHEEHAKRTTTSQEDSSSKLCSKQHDSDGEEGSEESEGEDRRQQTAKGEKPRASFCQVPKVKSRASWFVRVVLQPTQGTTKSDTLPLKFDRSSTHSHGSMSTHLANCVKDWLDVSLIRIVRIWGVCRMWSTLGGNGLKSTQVLLRRIIRLVIETGSVTAAIAILNLVLAVLPSHPSYFEVPSEVLAKVYSNSMLVVLNSRMKIGSDDFPDVTVSQNRIEGMTHGTEGYELGNGVRITREQIVFPSTNGNKAQDERDSPTISKAYLTV
ncbi:hypothetical protein BDZ97DRAFT_1764014 [Flammula alnicola]|nr:hypothetical protein BDZ97DRAFT_1764014 [Flammula alnicola]